MSPGHVSHRLILHVYRPITTCKAVKQKAVKQGQEFSVTSDLCACRHREPEGSQQGVVAILQPGLR